MSMNVHWVQFTAVWLFDLILVFLTVKEQTCTGRDDVAPHRRFQGYHMECSSRWLAELQSSWRERGEFPSPSEKTNRHHCWLGGEKSILWTQVGGKVVFLRRKGIIHLEGARQVMSLLSRTIIAHEFRNPSATLSLDKSRANSLEAYCSLKKKRR